MNNLLKDHMPPSDWRYRLGILALLWWAGLYLRIPVLVAPPLEPRISAELGLNQSAAGALTTLPVLMLAAGALVGSLVIARLGVRHTVVAGLALAAAASPARGLAPPPFVLFLATGMMGLGIAVMQPAMAALANLWCPRYVAVAIGVYMNGMYTGEFIGAGLTGPVVLPLAGGDWRRALLLWSLPVLPLLVGLYLPGPTSGERLGRPTTPWPNWRNSSVWRLGLLLGATSVLYMGTNAYMVNVLQSRGEAQALQDTLLWFNISQVVASLVMLALAHRLVMRRLPLIATLLVSLLAALCFVFIGGAFGRIAVFVLGMALAMQLTLVIMTAPYLAASVETGRTTAGIFAIGYSISFTVPLLGGWFAEYVGRPWMAMLPMLGYAAATLPLALTLRLPVTDPASARKSKAKDFMRR